MQAISLVAKDISPGRIYEVPPEEDLNKFIIPHYHLFDSDEGVIRMGFQKNPKILGLRCSCGEIRLL